MSKKIIDDDTLQGIADAIRSQDGTTDPIVVSNMKQKILDIPTGGEYPSAEGVKF